ncbi:MAG TPA: hypothetical protein VE155_09580 [Pseudonocardiaceae bacterium]|nr:hypothetical protein [Pseudonocardiaceae bacterium]
MTIRVYVQVDEQRHADACRCLSAARQIEEQRQGGIGRAGFWFPVEQFPADAGQLPANGQLDGIHIYWASKSQRCGRSGRCNELLKQVPEDLNTRSSDDE